jgi:hypothetical protein
LVKVNGRKHLNYKEDLQMNIMENISMIKSVVMENFVGQVVTLIKGVTKMMREMVMEKWSGLIVVNILESG